MPLPPQVPQQPAKLVTSTSVQCDPEPIPQLPVPIVPEPIKKQKQIALSSSSESDLTQSTKYSSSDQLSTTTSSETENDAENEDQDDSYFSEGAWLLSKSEGQIIQGDQNVFVNLDLATAVKSVTLNPRNNISERQIPNDPANQSEGEVNLSKINAKATSELKQKTGINKITRALEEGEVMTPADKTLRRIPSDKSEGELENTSIIFARNQEALLNSFVSKKKPISKKEIQKHHSKKAESPVRTELLPNDKTFVKDEKRSSQNATIEQIKTPKSSTPNEIMVRDSNDFERRMYSSTPDTSIYTGTGPIAVQSLILMDDFTASNAEEAANIYLNSKKNARDQQNKAKTSSIFSTEIDDDTFNSMLIN
jgi:hypothetical protein